MLAFTVITSNDSLRMRGRRYYSIRTAEESVMTVINFARACHFSCHVLSAHYDS